MHDDFYQMYLEELEALTEVGAEEEKNLLARLYGGDGDAGKRLIEGPSLIHLSQPTRQEAISYAVFFLKKKKNFPLSLSDLSLSSLNSILLAPLTTLSRLTA